VVVAQAAGGAPGRTGVEEEAPARVARVVGVAVVPQPAQGRRVAASDSAVAWSAGVARVWGASREAATQAQVQPVSATPWAEARAAASLEAGARPAGGRRRRAGRG
jgi:hypothetical protein